MNNALHPTALQRFAARLRALYLASLCCFVLQAIGAAWRDSWCCAQLSRILGKPAACASSRAHAILARLSVRMERHSDRLAGRMHELSLIHISFVGVTPSAIIKTEARIWSVMTRRETSILWLIP